MIYLLRALWDVSTGTERFAFLAEVAPPLRRLVIGAAVMVVCTEPLVNHFALSVMTDSLATSFTTVGVAALVRIAALGDVRLRTGLLGWLSIAAAGFMRAEKVWVFTLVVGATLAALAVLGRWPIPFRSQQSGRLSFRASVLLATLLLTPSLIVPTVNGATQKADYGWPPLTASVRLFVRTAWPRLADIRPLLSEETQAIVSTADASAFDGRYNEYLRLVPRLRRSAGGTDRLVNEISFAALRHRGVDIAIATTIDALRYMVPMIAYPVDLMLAARTASPWTASRMSMAHPTLTRIYLAIATVLLLAIQLPLFLYALASREKGHSAIVIAALLIFGTALVNAILYAVGNGLQNVRYALPAYVLVYSAVVWANAAVLGNLQRGVRQANPPLGRTE